MDSTRGELVLRGIQVGDAERWLSAARGTLSDFHTGDLVRRAASTGSFSSMGSSFAGSVRSRSGKDSVRSPTPAQRKKLPRDHGVVVSATGLAARVHWAGEVYNYAAAALPLTALERHRAFDASDAARLESETSALGEEVSQRDAKIASLRSARAREVEATKGEAAAERAALAQEHEAAVAELRVRAEAAEKAGKPSVVVDLIRDNELDAATALLLEEADIDEVAPKRLDKLKVVSAIGHLRARADERTGDGNEPADEKASPSRVAVVDVVEGAETADRDRDRRRAQTRGVPDDGVDHDEP